MSQVPLLPKGYGRQLLRLDTLARTRDASGLTQLLGASQVIASPKLRGAVASALGNSRDPAAVSALVALLRTDGDDEVRTFAARGLGSLGRAESLAALCGALEDPSTRVQVGVVIALGEIDAPGALDALEGLRDNRDVAVRAYAAESLGKIDDPRAIDALAALRADRDVTVRVHAVQALSTIDDPRVVEPLCAYLSDRKRLVRVDAAKALARVGDERAVAPLTEAYRRQRYPYKLLIGDQLATLRRRIGSPDQS